MTAIRAAQPLEASSLPKEPFASLCHDYINGLCRRGDRCPRPHHLCEPTDSSSQISSHASYLPTTNILKDQARRTVHENIGFEDDGPGLLSTHGPRHNNDHINIRDIQILPTADEILSLRRPYMPKKDKYNYTIGGVARLIDLHFRHLRYDNTEPIIDICYHACQYLTRTSPDSISSDYDGHMQTPRGLQYSLFHSVNLFETQFREARGVSFRISYACPPGLRGNKLHKSTCLQEGMLAALIGIDPSVSTLSISFVEVLRRESTMAMSQRNGNDLRGKLSLLWPNTYSDSRSIMPRHTRRS